MVIAVFLLSAVLGVTRAGHALDSQAAALAKKEKAQAEAAARQMELQKEQEAAAKKMKAQKKPKNKGLKDGVYYGSGQGYGGAISVKVTVKGGAMTDIEIESAPGETASFFGRAREILPRMINAGTANVDEISGATLSSNGIKTAVAAALKQAGSKEEVTLKPAVKTNPKPKTAKKKKKFKKPEGGWKDGTFKGKAPGFGGTVHVVVTIKKGKIKKITATGSGETASFWKKAKGVIRRIIKKQSPQVDAVSGATYSSLGIINAVVDALNKAVKPDSKKKKKKQKKVKPKKKPKPKPKPPVQKKQQVITMEEYEDGAVLDFTPEDIGTQFPLNAKTSGDGKLTYESADPEVVSVDEEGLVTLLAEGTSRIQITAAETKKFSRATAFLTIRIFSEEAPPEPVLINGTFAGQGRGYGGPVDATVEIVDSKITKIDVEGKKETQKYWFKAKKIVPKMIKAQTWDVDAISGATLSSNGIRDAVHEALRVAGLIE